MNLVTGYFLLRGKNWARYAAVATSIGILVFSFAVSPMKMLPIVSIPLVLAEAYFLFRRSASEFFDAVGSGAAIANEFSWWRITSNCFYVAAGMLFGGSAIIAFMKFPESGAERFADVSSKWSMLAITSVIPLVTLLIGQALSDGSSRRRELGIVFLASTAVGLMMFLTIAVVSLDASWQNSLPENKRWGPSDYWNGFSWLGLLGGFGALALFAGRVARK